MGKPKIIISDLNKTLIKENSWLTLNVAMGVKLVEDDILMSWGSEGEGIISDAEGQKILCSIYRKRGNPTRDSILKVIGSYTYIEGAQDIVQTL